MWSVSIQKFICNHVRFVYKGIKEIHRGTKHVMTCNPRGLDSLYPPLQTLMMATKSLYCHSNCFSSKKTTIDQILNWNGVIFRCLEWAIWMRWVTSKCKRTKDHYFPITTIYSKVLLPLHIDCLTKCITSGCSIWILKNKNEAKRNLVDKTKAML